MALTARTRPTARTTHRANAMPIALHQLGQGTTSISLDLRVYSLSALKKAAYRLADRCTIVLSHVSETSVNAALVSADGSNGEELLRSFLDEALDQELREQIGAATSGVRDLILAHAFSRTRLVNNTES